MHFVIVILFISPKITVIEIFKGIEKQAEMVSPLHGEEQYFEAVPCSLVESCSAVQCRY